MFLYIGLSRGKVGKTCSFMQLDLNFVIIAAAQVFIELCPKAF